VAASAALRQNARAGFGLTFRCGRQPAEEMTSLFNRVALLARRASYISPTILKALVDLDLPRHTG
jgi:hypothetical protein